MSDYISDRAIGYFPLSIATSLAIEKMLGFTTDEQGMTTQAKIKPATNYSHLWINVATLFRNLHGSLQRDTDHLVSNQVLATALILEIKQILQIVSEHSPQLECVFYVASHNSIKSTYPGAVLREPKSANQLAYREKLVRSIGYLLSLAENEKIKIRNFSNDVLIHGSFNVLIMTHTVIDLLTEPKLRTLDLLESHTGTIKPKALWYTKLITAKTMPNIPFNKLTLLVFGDSENFSPQSHAVKNALLQLATDKKWSAVTSLERIKGHISEVKDTQVKDHLKLLAR